MAAGGLLRRIHDREWSAWRIHNNDTTARGSEAMVQTGASWDVDGVDSAGKAVHMCIRSNLARARQLGEQEQDLADLRLQRRRPAAGGRAAASATRALAKGTIFEDVISTIKERGMANFMNAVKEAGTDVHVLRSEAAKNNLELVGTRGPLSCDGLLKNSNFSLSLLVCCNHS
uniref:Uncharacterized protein n=1 Tax=Leersia perrieri TaxID=77586 RepID=A0A0D9W6C4_9ORYZ